MPLAMSNHDRRCLVVLGRAVRMARHQRAWSQRELEERSGVDQTTISRIERGLLRGTDLVRFARVAWALEWAMPLGGCPHQHRCAWTLRWAAVLEEVAPMVPDATDSIDDRSVEAFKARLRAEI
jgi:DNA-binding XRE family transcriptional regulator